MPRPARPRRHERAATVRRECLAQPSTPPPLPLYSPPHSRRAMRCAVPATVFAPSAPLISHPLHCICIRVWPCNDASTSTEPPLLRSAQRQRDADAPGFHARPPPTRTLPHNASAVLPLPSLWPLPNFLVCTRPHGASKRKPAALPLVSHPPRPLVCASPTATFAAPLHDANASAPALTHAERCK
ncbi:hypothetical protein B0H13DRAFT_2507925 [Mycena leptocephala]|nr:hypothetical protein B0H13DRAFT_2507925 [Mycena leptocephala]